VIVPREVDAKEQGVRPRVIVSGIGTGGHYFPAVVTGLELKRRKCEVLFLARKGYQEERIARHHGLKIFSINSRPFYGRSFFDKLLSAGALVQSVFRLHALTRNSIGLAFGGFGAVPLNISCMLNRSAFYVFEPNRVPGRATRIFTHAAQRIFLGLPSLMPMRSNMHVTGIPIRPEFKNRKRSAGRKKGKGIVYVLVYGGSQGARFLNDIALKLQHALPGRWRVTIITGVHDYERVTGYKKSSTRVIPFSDTPWEEIGHADIVVSRAGALAGYEILALGKKVIFIPFPFAIDDHQYQNAVYFAEVGDALVHEQANLTYQELAKSIQVMIRRKRRAIARIIMDAETRIVDLLIKDIV
jgi:UDP-N-acetylglucosamine--N-acetylmuramyl-(pentapeptide) pyrophosphoryl-undecaprenol N-acetylglucosamine transferase